MSQTLTDRSTSYDDVGADTLAGVRQIGAHIGKPPRQTYHLLENNLLPAFKLGRIWHMRKSSYQRFIERLETN